MPSIHTATPWADSSASGSWRMSLVIFGPSGSGDDGVDRLFQRAGLGGRPERFLPGLLELGPEFLKLFAAEAGPHFGEPVLQSHMATRRVGSGPPCSGLSR